MKRLFLGALVATIMAGCADSADPYMCMKNEDCLGKGKCVDGYCMLENENGCKSDIECIDPQKPLCRLGICVSSVSDKECSSNLDCKDPLKPVCNGEGLCIAQTESPECSSNADCKDPQKPICSEGGKCTAQTEPPECSSETDCKKPQINDCSEDGQCSEQTESPECSSNADCKDPQKPVCSENGQCVASAVSDEPTCGDGKVNGNEICDPKAEMTKTCSDFNSSVNWLSGRKPKCSETCELLQGTCTENLCGNGIIDKGESCEPGQPVTAACSDFNSTKFWYTTGTPACSSECKLTQGTCMEDLCGNGKIDPGENCDFGRDLYGYRQGVMECSSYSRQYFSGNASCSLSCKYLDISQCLEQPHSGIFYCQLMSPVTVKFSPDNQTVTMNARVAATSVTDISGGNDGRLQAQLIYGSDLNDFGQWKSISASPDNSFVDPSVDAYTATLTREQFNEMQSDKVYYTFRFREIGKSNWFYCKANLSNPSVVDGGIDFLAITGDSSQVSATENDVGTAINTNVGAENVISMFTFDKHSTAEKDPTAIYTAEKGMGLIHGARGLQCDGSCFATDRKNGLAWNVMGWKYSRIDALSSGARIVIEDISTVDMDDIGLDFRVWRNNTNSPTKIIVRYSLDNHVYYELLPDIELGETNLRRFVDFSIPLNVDAIDQPSLYIELIPYGGNGVIHLDDITISHDYSD